MATDNSNKRNWLARGRRWAFACAALGGAYAVTMPEDGQDLEDGHDFTPNIVQREFLRLAAQKYDYVALGDTDHRRPELHHFAYHKDSVASLSKGGDRYIFIESGPEDNREYVDAIRTQPKEKVEERSRRHGNTSMWACNEQTGQIVSNVFEESVRKNPEINFEGVDQRHADGSDAHDAFSGPHFQMSMTIPIVFSILAHGCVTSNAAAIGGIIYTITGGKISEVLLDDRNTADYIRALSNTGGTLIYGASHFRTDLPYTIGNILQSHGHTLGKINLYPGGAYEKPSDVSDPHHGDAAMIVRHGGDPNHGIRAYTPDMQALYRQALENTGHAPKSAPAFTAG